MSQKVAVLLGVSLLAACGGPQRDITIERAAQLDSRPSSECIQKAVASTQGMTLGMSDPARGPGHYGMSVTGIGNGGYRIVQLDINQTRRGVTSYSYRWGSVAPLIGRRVDSDLPQMTAKAKLFEANLANQCGVPELPLRVGQNETAVLSPGSFWGK